MWENGGISPSIWYLHELPSFQLELVLWTACEFVQEVFGEHERVYIADTAGGIGLGGVSVEFTGLT